MKVKWSEITSHASVEFIFLFSDYNRTTVKMLTEQLTEQFFKCAVINDFTKLQTFHWGHFWYNNKCKLKHFLKFKQNTFTSKIGKDEKIDTGKDFLKWALS